MTLTSHRRRSLVFLLLAVPILVWCLAGVAFAHVTVDPSRATAGSEVTFTFHVPNEQDHATTGKLVFALPTANPIPVVSFQPVPGWTADVTTHKLAKPVQTDDGPVSEAVSRIVWSADDTASAIAPGEFQEFTIAAGPLPKTKLLMFKVLQYYSDGTVVRWIDPPSNGEEPAHPAPVVTLGQSAAAPGSTSGTASSATASSSAVSGDGWIAVAAFVAGLLGLGAGTAALVRVRSASNRGVGTTLDETASRRVPRPGNRG